MNSKEAAKKSIFLWKKALKDEHRELAALRNDIRSEVHKFIRESDLKATEPGSWTCRHRLFMESLHKLAEQLERFIELQHERANDLAVFYDVAQKEQGTVIDIYDKLEECVEILRTELKDIVKKLYAFATLEMEYYEKLLQAYDPGNMEDARHLMDYDDLRTTLNGIYRHDQYFIVLLQMDTSFATIDNTLHKFIAILESNDHSIDKMYSGTGYNPLV